MIPNWTFCPDRLTRLYRSVVTVANILPAACSAEALKTYGSYTSQATGQTSGLPEACDLHSILLRRVDCDNGMKTLNQVVAKRHRSLFRQISDIEGTSRSPARQIAAQFRAG
jgi:hypothetical protein